MKKIINLVLIFALFQTTSCQNKKEKIMTSTINREQDYTIDGSKPKTGYFLQIN